MKELFYLPDMLASAGSNMSVWYLISNSSAFALLILLIMLGMSFVSLAILASKFRQFRLVERENRRFISAFRKRRRLVDAYGKCSTYRKSPLARLLEDGFSDLQQIVKRKKGEGNLQAGPVNLNSSDLDAIGKTLEKTANEEIGKLERMVVFLGTTGTVAPFFGLLGTCWGVMRSFMNIGTTGQASLAVVAPGIAEALIATIVGLAVAIPAVIAFNWCNNKLKYVQDDLNNFSLEFLSAVEKENSF
ncbi:MAG: Tol-Pal system subunit TolQ [candidate division Zixibacteria bacterium]|nr:Tol-Pal system subunit TolQ [candidate division Zixibacteria bacterium]